MQNPTLMKNIVEVLIGLILLRCSYCLVYNGTICSDTIDFTLDDSTAVVYFDNYVTSLLTNSTPYPIPIWASLPCRSHLRVYYCLEVYIEHAEDTEISICNKNCKKLESCHDLIEFVSIHNSVSYSDVINAWGLPDECLLDDNVGCAGNLLQNENLEIDQPQCPNPFFPSHKGYPLSEISPSGCSVGCPDPFVLSKSEFQSTIEIYLALGYLGLISSFITFLIVRITSSFEQKNHFFELYCLSCFCISLSIVGLLQDNNIDAFCPTEETYLKETNRCVFQGFVISWCYIAGMWSAAFIVLDVFVKLVIGISRKRARNLRRFGFLFVFALSTSSSLAGLLTGSFGFDPLQSVPMCMHMISRTEIVYIFSYAVPTLLSTVLTFYMAIQISRRLNSIINSQQAVATRMTTEFTTQKSFSIVERRDADLSTISSEPTTEDLISPKLSPNNQSRLKSFMKYNVQPIGFLVFAVATQLVISGIGIHWAVNGVSDHHLRNSWTNCILLNSLESLVSNELSDCDGMPRTGRRVWQINLIGVVPALLGSAPLLAYIPAVIVGFRKAWRLLTARFKMLVAVEDVDTIIRPDITNDANSPKRTLERTFAGISERSFDKNKLEADNILRNRSFGGSFDERPTEVGLLLRPSVGTQELLPESDLCPDLLDSDEAAVSVVIDSEIRNSLGRMEDLETKKIATRFLRHVTAVEALGGLDVNSEGTERGMEMTVVREKVPSMMSRKSSSIDSVRLNKRTMKIPNQITVNGREIAKVVQWIGSGAFGSVYHVKSVSGIHFAMKSMDLESIDNSKATTMQSSFLSAVIDVNGDDKTLILRRILSFLDEISVSLLIPPHPNVAAVRYVCRSKFVKQSVVLSFADFVNAGDLEKHFSKPWDSILFKGDDVFDVEAGLLDYIIQLFSAVAWLHSCNVIHQDLKPENVMIDVVEDSARANFGVPNIRFRVADFGFATEGRKVFLPFAWFDNWKDNSVTDQDSVNDNTQCPPGATMDLIAALHGCTQKYASFAVIERKEYIQKLKQLVDSGQISSMTSVSTDQSKLCGANRLVTTESPSSTAAVSALVTAKESDIWSAALVCLQLFCRGWCPWEGSGGEALNGLREYLNAISSSTEESKQGSSKLGCRDFWTMDHDQLLSFMRSDPFFSNFAGGLTENIDGWALGNSSDKMQEAIFGIRKTADLLKLRKRLRKMFCYTVPEAVCNILKRCFDERPWLRPSAAEIVQELNFISTEIGQARNRPVARARSIIEEEFSRTDSQLSASYYNLGLAYSFHGFYGRSLQCYAKSLERRPTYAPALYNIGILLQLAGHETEATQNFRLAMESDPSDSKAVFNYGVSMMSNGRWDEARQMFQKSLQLQSNHVPSLHGLSRCIVIDGDIEELVTVYRRLADADMRSSSIAWRLGVVDRLFSSRRSSLVSFLRGCNCSSGKSLESLGFIGLEMLMHQDEGRLNVTSVDKTRLRIRSSIVGKQGKDMMVSDGPIMLAMHLAKLGVESPFVYSDPKEIMKDMLCDMFQTLNCLELLYVLRINNRNMFSIPNCLIGWSLTDVVESITETCLMNSAPVRKSIGAALIAFCFAQLAADDSLRIHRSMQQLLSSHEALCNDFRISVKDARKAGVFCSEELLRLARYRCPDIEIMVSDYFVAIGHYRLARKALTKALFNPQFEMQTIAQSRLNDLLELETSSFGTAASSNNEADNFQDDDMLGEVVGVSLFNDIKGIRAQNPRKLKLHGHAKKVIHRLLL